MTKWLLTLSAAQTVLLAALGLKVFAMDAPARNVSGPTPGTQMQSAADPATLSWDNARAPSVSATEVRAILREELAALENSAQPGAQPAQAQRPQQTPQEIRVAATAVDNDISVYRSRGAINEPEMAALQMKIMKLPLAERRAALTQLAKALSSGAIDGQM